jgi:twitching motility protein PilT
VRDVLELFTLAVQRKASDLHITEEAAPVLRIDGRIEPIEQAPLDRAECKQLVYSILSDRQKSMFEQELELDISFSVRDVGRFRVNVHQQRGSVEAAFRVIPSEIRALTELGLPPVAGELARKPNGLVLVTGATGSGKTTTLASIVDMINTNSAQHIITVEDPIEYVHTNKQSIVKQREVYSDTLSFAQALRRVLRQDPDVIVVGEMRDLETISTALTAAETGHLVLATLHTQDAAQTVDRIIDVFPPHQQAQIKVQLSACFQGVISQRLLPRADIPGRVMAAEVMVATSAVRNLIREHGTEQFHTIMQTGSQYGMRTLDASLRDLYKNKMISYETALSNAKHPSELKIK